MYYESFIHSTIWYLSDIFVTVIYQVFLTKLNFKKLNQPKESYYN